MSLRVWLPLNGTLDNQGLDDIVVTNSGATVNNSGKIGKCYSFDGSDDRIYANNILLNNSAMSACCWVKLNSITNNNYPYIFALGSNTTGNGIQIGLAIWKSDSKLHLVGHGAEPASNYTPPLNSWIHLCITISGTSTKLYVNGILTDTKTNSNSPKTQNCLCIGARPNSTSGAGVSFSYPLNGYINDFRLYDHALSPMEVKQISQGLILHYPLNNVIGGLPRLWSLASYTRSIDLTTSYAYVYSIPGNTVWLTPGKQYTVAAEIKVNQNNILFYFDSNCSDADGVYSGNDAAQTVQYNPIINLEKDKWVPVYITTTIKSDAGRPYYHHGFLFRTNSGTLTTNCEIRNIEVYEGDLKLRRGLLSTDTTEYDCSGYCNNGTRTGTFSWTGDTPRYNVSTVFNGTERIKRDTLDGEIYTLACWAKTTKNKSTSQQIIADSKSEMTISFYKGTIIGVFGTTRGRGSKSTLGSSYKENNWNHFVVVKTGTSGERAIYCNGVLLTPTSNDYWGAASGFFVGAKNDSQDNPFYGQICDVRAYATALSAEDILSLYNNSAYIDNQGNIYGAIYEEV